MFNKMFNTKEKKITTKPIKARGKGGELFFLFFLLSFTRTKVTLVNASNFDSLEKKKLTSVITEVEKIINTKKFSELISSHSFNNENKFSDSINKSNKEVLQDILSGRETLSSKVDYEWQLNLNQKWLFSASTLAYTTSDSPVININSRYFKKASESDLAGTICHEYTHKLGYMHDQKHTKIRPYSVPYGVGNICSLLYTKGDTVNFSKNLPVSSLLERECGVWCSLKGLFNVN